MTDYLFHEHYGKPHAFRQGGDTALYGVWYTRWICSSPNCSQIVLLVKPAKEQKTVVQSGGIVSAYGFSVDDIVVDKKSGRRARVERFDQEYEWRRFDGRNQRVPVDRWRIVYRWIEADPRKPEGRIIDTLWGLDNERFSKRFRKQTDGE